MAISWNRFFGLEAAPRPWIVVWPMTASSRRGSGMGLIFSVSFRVPSSPLQRHPERGILHAVTDIEPALPTLETDRLTLVALTPQAYAAWAAGDAVALAAATGAAFADASAPPLLAEDLAKIRDLVLERWEPDAIGWWGWLATLSGTREPVGSVGFAGRPDEGIATIGYSIYERHQGRGYGTEATGAVVAWALSQDGVRGVRATIPGWNGPSVRLAEKIGFVMTGTADDPEVGEVLVYEIGRP